MPGRLASYVALQRRPCSEVVDLTTCLQRDAALVATPVEAICGLGPGYMRRLTAQEITTA